MKKNINIIVIAFTAAIGGFLLGFDGSVISGAIPFYKSYFGLTDGSFLLGFSVSCIIWGSIIGNLIAGPLSDRIGRKPSLLISAVLFTATGLMCAFANNITVFILGRIIGGLGVGIAILVAPIYIAEIAPPRQRGWLVSFNQLLIVIGLSAAYFSNYFILKIIVDPIINWRYMLGIEVIPSIIYFIATLFIPESPRWLIMKGKDEKGLNIMKNLGDLNYVNNEYQLIKKSFSEQKKESLNIQINQLFSKKMRNVLIIGFGLAILQQFSGINAILYYAPMIFESAGGSRDTAFLQAVVLGLVFLVVTILSMFLIDRLGRKPLLYIGVSLMATSLTFTGILFSNATYRLTESQIKKELALLEIPNTVNIETITQNNYSNEQSFINAIDKEFQNFPEKLSEIKARMLKVAIKINAFWVLMSILGFIAGFSISLGPVMWAIFSEIFPNHLRGLAISMVGTANAIASFLVATFFPLQLTKFGSANTYFIYASFMFFCLWFTWKYVVETKGKSLEQLEKELIKE
jgi:sugar porter (SP) family MFS transporter